MNTYKKCALWIALLLIGALSVSLVVSVFAQEDQNTSIIPPISYSHVIPVYLDLFEYLALSINNQVIEMFYDK